MKRANFIHFNKLGEEQPLKPEGKNAWNQANAICWASGRTLGKIAVFSKSILGSFPAQAEDDALLPCDFVPAGKFRHGADRWFSCDQFCNYAVISLTNWSRRTSRTVHKVGIEVI